MTDKGRRVFWVTYEDETTGYPEKARHHQILAASEEEARSAAIRFYTKRWERVTKVEDTGVTEAEYRAKGGRVI